MTVRNTAVPSGRMTQKFSWTGRLLAVQSDRYSCAPSEYCELFLCGYSSMRSLSESVRRVAFLWLYRNSVRLYPRPEERGVSLATSINSICSFILHPCSEQRVHIHRNVDFGPTEGVACRGVYTATRSLSLMSSWPSLYLTAQSSYMQMRNPSICAHIMGAFQSLF
ncbi:MAG: hypothetical protein J07HQX50_00847 [Haloquadratum sp. J07HQX50]|nr:MAG: hypothetical protein J07HQX50_00847 [Haloquadratum sp. J07HQX50]